MGSLTRRRHMTQLVVFTDLDGTLLDHHTYGWKEAHAALEYCRKSGAPVILVSSKTGAEMDVLRRQLDLSAPFVSENGGRRLLDITHRSPSESSSFVTIT